MSWLIGNMWPILAAIGGLMSAVIALLLHLVQKGNRKNAELEDYQETRNRMDQVGRMADADAARERLRERGKR